MNALRALSVMPRARRTSAAVLASILMTSVVAAPAAERRWADEASASLPRISGGVPFFVLGPNQSVAAFGEAEEVPPGDGSRAQENPR